MSLIRCSGCKLDTSDSLEHCPYCGAGLGGKPARTMEAQIGAVTSDTPGGRFGDAPAIPMPAPKSPAAARPTPNKLLRGVLGLIVLVVFFGVRGGPAIVILAAVAYAILKARAAVSPAQIEALRRFAEQAKANRAQGRPASERPLDVLRQIETQIREARQRDRA